MNESNSQAFVNLMAKVVVVEAIVFRVSMGRIPFGFQARRIHRPETNCPVQTFRTQDTETASFDFADAFS
jgi:hypothetical protein